MSIRGPGRHCATQGASPSVQLPEFSAWRHPEGRAPMDRAVHDPQDYPMPHENGVWSAAWVPGSHSLNGSLVVKLSTPRDLILPFSPMEASPSGSRGLSVDQRRGGPQLTQEICACKDWEELRWCLEPARGAIDQAILSSLDKIHLAASFVVLAKQQARGQGRVKCGGYYELVEHLSLQVMQRMHLVSHRQCANMLWALATLMPSLEGHSKAGPIALTLSSKLYLKMQQFWDEDGSVLLSVVGAASPQSLSNSLWAMAKLGMRPSGHWLQGYLSHSLRLGLSGFISGELSSMLWAMAKMRLWPGKAWVESCVLSLSQKLEMMMEDATRDGEAPGLTQFIANSIWALATLGVSLPLSFQRQLEKACLHVLNEFSAEELSAVLWAAATIQKSKEASEINPDNASTSSSTPASDFVHSSAGLIHKRMESGPRGVSPRSLATSVWSLARLGFQPSLEFKDSLYEITEQFFQEMEGLKQPSRLGPGAPLSGAGLCQLTWALSRWHCTPPSSWLQSMSKGAMRGGLSRASPKTAATLLSSLGKFQQSYHDRWQGQEDSRALEGGGLRVVVEALEPGFVHVLVAASARGLNGSYCPPSLAVEMCWAMGELQIWPGRGWIKRLISNLFGSQSSNLSSRNFPLRTLTPRETSRLLVGLSRMPVDASGNMAAQDPTSQHDADNDEGSWLDTKSKPPDSNPIAPSQDKSNRWFLPRPLLCHFLSHLAATSCLGAEKHHPGNAGCIAEALWAAVKLGVVRLDPLLAQTLISLAVGSSSQKSRHLSSSSALRLSCAVAILERTSQRPSQPQLQLLTPSQAQDVSNRVTVGISLLDDADINLLSSMLLFPPLFPTDNALDATRARPSLPTSAVALRLAVERHLVQFPSKHLSKLLGSLVSRAQRTEAWGIGLLQGWGNVVHEAAVRTLDLPGYGGLSLAARSSLLGACLVTGHLPSPLLLESWFKATTPMSAKSRAVDLSPPQLLATLRFACASASASSSRDGSIPIKAFLSFMDSSALRLFHKREAEWGPARLVALVAAMQSLGHVPSEGLLEASRRSLSDHLSLCEESRAFGPEGTHEGLALTLDSLIELTLLTPAAIRPGLLAKEAVPALLRYVQSQTPQSVLCSLSLPSSLSGHEPVTNDGQSALDPFSPYYSAAAVLGSKSRQSSAHGARRLCALLDSLASWGLTPKGAWLSSLIQGACSPSHEEPQDLALSGPHASSLIRALALMQASDVTGATIQSILSLLTPASMAKCSSKQMSDVAWSLGAIQYRPEHSWWESFEASLLANDGRMLHGMSGRSLCDLSWACASIRLVPSSTVMSSLLNASLRRLPSLDPPSLAGLLWSLCILEDGGPGQLWMSGWISESASKMSSFQAHDLAVAISALSTARHKPKQDWSSRFMSQVRAKLDQCRPIHISRILYGLAKLDIRPDAAWTCDVMCWLTEMRPRDLDPESSSQLQWALGKLVAPVTASLDPSAQQLPLPLNKLNKYSK